MDSLIQIGFKLLESVSEPCETSGEWILSPRFFGGSQSSTRLNTWEVDTIPTFFWRHSTFGQIQGINLILLLAYFDIIAVILAEQSEPRSNIDAAVL